MRQRGHCARPLASPKTHDAAPPFHEQIDLSENRPDSLGNPAMDHSSVAMTLERIASAGVLAAHWRALEAQADGSFFLSWTWVGCLASERYDRPVVLRAESNGRTVALALCNQRSTAWSGQTLWLNESGELAWDSVFVEHNGPLVTGGNAILAAALHALLHAPIGKTGSAFGRRVILSGVGPDVLEAARRLGAACHIRQTRLAPRVDLHAIGGLDGLLESMSRSTRYQLRRSMRLYEKSGPLTLHAAQTVPMALEWFDRMAALHQASWNARGAPGAFAETRIRRFHHALIESGHPRGEVEMLRVTAGADEVGYLYNFRWRGRVYAYQSGFLYEADARKKPGLACHALAIEHYIAQGFDWYDFLAGDDRYKRAFTHDEVRMHWVELARPFSLRGLALKLRS